MARTTPNERPRPQTARVLGDWVDRLRDRLGPTTYVNWSDVPDEPLPPYRARLTLPPDEESSGTEIQERDVVRGKVRTIYEVRCDCGTRWFNTKFERVQLCPRCDRAVLLDEPNESGQQYPQR
jgi:hypothetical protein